MLPAVNYYHKALHLGCCSSPRSASDITWSNEAVDHRLSTDGETITPGTLPIIDRA